MQQQQQLMTTIMLAVLSGEKVDPELLKSMMKPANGAPQAPVGPIMSGVATGEIRKPVGEFDPSKAGLDGKPVEVKKGQTGLEAYERHNKNKTERVKEAAATLR